MAKGILDDIRAGVREEIKDPAKASEAVGLVDQMEQMIMEASEARKAHEDRIVSVNGNYDATEEDFKAVFREFNAKKNSRQDRLVGIFQQAKALTTAGEWKGIAKVKAHALVCMAVFDIAKGLVRGLIGGLGPMGAVDEVRSRFNYEWLPRALVVFSAFIPFFAVRELRRVLGEGVIGIFFQRGSAMEPGSDPSGEDVRKVMTEDS